MNIFEDNPFVSTFRKLIVISNFRNYIYVTSKKKEEKKEEKN